MSAGAIAGIIVGSFAIVAIAVVTYFVKARSAKPAKVTKTDLTPSQASV